MKVFSNFSIGRLHLIENDSKISVCGVPKNSDIKPRDRKEEDEICKVCSGEMKLIRNMNYKPRLWLD